jgi:hypothetical protein
MRARACLQFRQQVAYVRLHGLLGQEEALADLPVDEAVRDQLQNLDLTHRRLLLELPQGRGELDDLAGSRSAASSELVEPTGVIGITGEDLPALGSVHDVSRIGGTRPGL